MTDTGIFCSGTHIIHKAGVNVNSTAISEAYTNDFIAQAESEINVATRYNWSEVFSTLDDDVKMILRGCASDKAAMYAINYDLSRYTTKVSNTMLNVLRDSYERSLTILKDIKQQDFIKDA